MPTDPQVRDQLAHDHARLHHLQGLIPALRRSWQRAKAAGVHPLAERRHGTLQGAVDAAHHDEQLIHKLVAELERIDDNIRGRIVQAAHRALTEKARYEYAEVRPYPPSLFGSTPRRMDCSGFLTLCYKEGGAQDPNHLDYNGEGYCHTPDTRVLTAGLQWVPAGDIAVGDELWALDERAPGDWADHDTDGARQNAAKRRFRKATVLSSFATRKECVSVEMDDGQEVKCTTDHPWLAYNDTRVGAKRWWTRPADLLERRPNLVRPFTPWREDRSYDAGWLAGLLDGEGWVTKRAARGGRPHGFGMTQVVGPVAEHAENALARYGDFYTASVKRPGLRPRVDITSRGGIMATAEALGRLRPMRLIDNLDLSGCLVPARVPARVKAVRPLGTREIQSIQTSAGTYFAEGFAVHNTGTLIDHAIKQPHPLLADVCFYGDQGGGVPVHVTIHVGNGLVISMGSPGDPSIGPAEQMGPSGFRGYWTFPSVIPRVTPLPGPGKAPAAKPAPARKPGGHHLPVIHHGPARREIHHGGPDVYAGDGTVNWRQVAHSGHDIGICKATEGLSFVDPALGRNARGIKAAGLIRGFYHFAHPSNNPAAEAWHFLHTIGGLVNDQDRLILDIEVSDGQGEQHIRRWVHDFLTVVHHQHPRNEQWTYTSSLFIAWDRHPDRRYWVADYSSRLIVPAGVDRHQIVLWQKTDAGHVPGVPGACDVNILPS